MLTAEFTDFRSDEFTNAHTSPLIKEANLCRRILPKIMVIPLEMLGIGSVSMTNSSFIKLLYRFMLDEHHYFATPEL